MTVPAPWATVLLALAAFRTWKLLADDVILDRPRDWLSESSLMRYWDKHDEPGNPVGTFIHCPWCLGFWVALLWWLAYEACPHWAVVAAVPFALSALVGLTGQLLDGE